MQIDVPQIHIFEMIWDANVYYFKYVLFNTTPILQENDESQNLLQNKVVFSYIRIFKWTDMIFWASGLKGRSW